MSTNKKLPPIWLFIVILISSHLSENVLSPALPDISQFFSITEEETSNILTIFLLGFAAGTLFWGRISDIYGRRPCLLIGIAVFAVGSIGCAFSNSLDVLLISRFVQAFGSSTGSVLGQSIARDSFQGPERGKIFSIIGSFMALAPAFGPFIGGFINDISTWQNIFIFLVIFGTFAWSLIYSNLPETFNLQKRSSIPFFEVLSKIIRDPKVLSFALMMAFGVCVRIAYAAEAGFYLVDILGMEPTYYGLSFIGIALASSVGSYASKRMNDKMTSVRIILVGCFIMVIGAFVFSISAVIFSYFSVNKFLTIASIIISMTIIMFGIGVSLPNSLSIALEDYNYAIGSASSIFGCMYYIFSSICVFIAGILHHQTMLYLPFYFLAITVFATIVMKVLVHKKIL